MIFDLANFHKRSKDYKTAIKYYSQVIENLNANSEIKSDFFIEEAVAMKEVEIIQMRIKIYSSL